MKYGIIGCGNMGSALLRGLIVTGAAKKTDIFVADKSNTVRTKLKKKLPKEQIVDARTVAKKSQVLILAVKPQDLQALLEDIAEAVNDRAIIVSICAGVQISFLKKFFGTRAKIVRAMPNMPALIGQGVAALCATSAVTKKDKKAIMRIFENVGKVVEVKEKDLDIVTAVSGSGPAYFFYIIGALEKVGWESGLPRLLARELAIETAIGSSFMAYVNNMACVSRTSMKDLIKRVASKGGTTEAALRVFNQRRIAESFISGVRAAKRRSETLSRKLSCGNRKV
ncbi:MAG: pyrroline-5-carboxylate reductase [Candidatus Omnitrophica bacterium]|nr:pyrroline-5-carboxylate reductase [Candidatus Omnitrophota bacterium]